MKAIVFDMDGVLFDTERLCMESWVRTAKEWSIHDIEDVFRQCIGLNANDTKTLVLNHYGESFPYDQYRKKASDWFWADIEKNGLPIMAGVKELLAFLKDTDLQVGLASSSKRESVISHLESAEMKEYFSVIVTGDMVKHSKPRPDIYLLACKELGVEPEEAYAIEDSPNGIRAAHAAGMKPIMVPDMIVPDEEMERLSFRICKNLGEVQTFLTNK